MDEKLGSGFRRNDGTKSICFPNNFEMRLNNPQEGG